MQVSFFYRFSFFISSWLQYTKSGFHEVGMERGLGHQTLPAQKCHQNISDMIHVDIRAGDRGEHPKFFQGLTAPGGPGGPIRREIFFKNFYLLTSEFDLKALLDPRMSFRGP